MIICAFFYIAVTRQLFDNFSTTSAGATAVPSSPLKCCVGWNGVGRGALVSADWVPPLHNQTNYIVYCYSDVVIDDFSGCFYCLIRLITNFRCPE